MLNAPTDRRHPIAVPTVDELASAPELAAILPAGATAALLGRCRVASAALEARLLTLAVEEHPPEPKADDQNDWLTAEQGAAMLRRKPSWLYRNKHLPSKKF